MDHARRGVRGLLALAMVSYDDPQRCDGPVVVAAEWAAHSPSSVHLRRDRPSASARRAPALEPARPPGQRGVRRRASMCHQRGVPVAPGRAFVVFRPQYDVSIELTAQPVRTRSCSSRYPAELPRWPRYESGRWGGLARGTWKSSEVDCWRTDGSAGDVLQLGVMTEGRQGAGWRIRRADGSVLCESTTKSVGRCQVDDRSGSFEIETWRRPVPSGGGSEQPYSIWAQNSRYERENESELCPRSAPGTYAGRRLHSAEPVRCYRIQVQQNGLVFDRKPGGPTIELRDPSVACSVNASGRSVRWAAAASTGCVSRAATATTASPSTSPRWSARPSAKQPPARRPPKVTLLSRRPGEVPNTIA